MSVPVPLEIDSNSVSDYRWSRDNVVSVQVWPFEEIMCEYLMDPFLFGEKDNLVSQSNSRHSLLVG
jgi:hypothetical protein